MNTNPALRNLYITVGVLIILALGAFFYIHGGQGGTGSVSTSTAATSTDGISLTGQGTEGATVTSVPTQTAIPAPDHTKLLTFSSSISADAQTALQAQFAADQKTLASDKTNFDAWVNLGTLRKITADYAGAEADWLYVAAIYPGSTVGHDNLAELYLDFIKNYPKAEAQYKAAIAADGADTVAYDGLVSLYTTYGYKTLADAKALVAAGLKANPGNAELLRLQAELNAQ